MAFQASIKKYYRAQIVELHAEEGYQKMALKSVVICCTVRDCGPALVRNIPRIESLRKKFKDSRVIIIENDSKDQSKELLKQWANSSPGVIVNSQDYGSITIPGSNGSGDFSSHRISKMARYRNLYMEEIDRLDMEPDYMLVLDPDVYDFSLTGIANSFGQPVQWDAISSNGISVGQAYRGLYRYKIFYDTYALRKFGDNRPQTHEMINRLQHAFADMQPGLPLIRVASGFNGMAIYRMEAVKGLRYVCEANADDRVQVLCEHVPFHREMAERGFDRIYINPSQVVVYETIWGNYLASAQRVFKRMLKKVGVVPKSSPRTLDAPADVVDQAVS